MKNALKKITLAALVLALLAGATASFAEETVSETVTVTPTPAVQTEDAENTPAPTADAEKDTPTEAPATQVPAPTAEPTAEPTEEPTAEPTAEPAAEPTEEPTTEPAAEPTAEPTAAPEEFTGTVEVELATSGEIFYGDTVELRAIIRDANTAYEIRWEVNKGGEWKTISGETRSTYRFVVSEENAAYEYRVVLITEA